MGGGVVKRASEPLYLNDFQEATITKILDNYGASCIIPAAPGAGKTLVVLGACALAKRKGAPHRQLVLCPKAAVSSFKRDVARFKDDLGLRGIFIASPNEMDAWLMNSPEARLEYDIVVIALHVIATFERPTTRGAGSRTVLDTFEGFKYLVLDEVHELRVSTSRKFLNTLYIKMKFSLPVIAMTATLFHTRLDDVFFTMYFIDKSIFPSYEAFKNRYMRHIVKEANVTRKYGTDFGTSSINSASQLSVFDGYTKEVTEVWEKIAPYVWDYQQESRFKTVYSFLHYEVSDMDGLISKLKGEGIYRIMHFDVISVNGGRRASFTRKPSDNIERNEKGVFIPRRMDDLKTGDIVRASTGAYQIVGISDEEDDSKLAQVILPVVQRYLSRDPNKLEVLKQKIGDGGALVFCEYIKTAYWLKDVLSSHYKQAKRVVVLDGSVGDKRSVLKRVDWDRDVVIVTTSAAQSLDYYFKTVILYEPIALPGKFIQLKGRITRYDATHSNIEVCLMAAPNSPEEYYHHRLCLMLRQSGAYGDVELPMETGFDSLDLLKKVKLWGLLGKK